MPDTNDIRGADAAAELWRRGAGLASSADAAVLTRAADCVLAALVEAIASARDPRCERGALALAPSRGPATVAAGDVRATLPDAIAANSFLIHATLSDDAYRLALHPGLAVIPAALARAEETGASGEAVLRAVAGGYEVACRLADALLPVVSERGFRITAAIAPAATAATIALLDGMGAGPAVEALRLACGAAGGGLRTVDAVGEGWSLQPALATGAGVAAVRAAGAGLCGAEGIVEAANGLHGSLCARPWPGLPADDEARIHRVTFKEHPVAMYGQAIFDAVLRGGPLPAGTDAVTVVVSPFAAGYGHQDSSDAESVGSVAGITRKALAAADPSLSPAIAVVGEEGLGPLDARVEAAGHVLVGSGDTSGWGPAEVAAHALRRAGDAAAPLVAACQGLAAAPGVSDVWDGWRAASR
jgi:2-methylcitrate dehydratase PrpD